MFLGGWEASQLYGHSKQLRQMRARVLNEILETPPEERINRMLDLCFFVVADKKDTLEILEVDVLPEVYAHLEMRLRQIELEGRRFENILTVDSQMGYEEQIKRVWKLIEEFRKRERGERELEKETSKDISESRKEGAENSDLEKGI
ncbi:hypothetical protein ABEW05_011415 [Botrytis cinerea]